MPFISGIEMGGGTIASKVAGQVAGNRAARDSSEIEDAVAPTNSSQNYDDVAGAPTARDAGAFDDDGPMWPDEAAENAYLSEQAGAALAAASVNPVSDNDSDDVDASAMPALDELVARIPEESRKLLDELFRAKFQKVRKIPKKLIS